MWEFNIRPKLRVLSDNEIDWLISKYFEIQLRNIRQISPINVYREKNFASLRALSYYLMAVQDLQDENIIDSDIAEIVRETIWLLFNNLEEHERKFQEEKFQSSDEDIQAHRQFIKFFHLAILITFNKTSLLGRKKRQKLLYLFKDQEGRKKALKICRDLQENGINKDSGQYEEFITIPAPITPEFTVYLYGMYERTMDDYVNVTLIQTNYVTREIAKNGSRYIKLTDRGMRYIKKLIKKSKQFRVFMKVAAELQPFFDDMTANELITFIKKYIIPDWDEKPFGMNL